MDESHLDTSSAGENSMPSTDAATEPKKPSRARQVIKLLIQVVISAAFFYVLSRQIDLGEAWSLIRSANFVWLFSGIVVFLIAQLISAYRWKVAALAFGLHVPYKRSVFLYFLGMFYNSFLPTGVGGDAVKGYLLSRETGRPRASIGSILIERASGMITLLLFGGVAVLLPQMQSLPQAVRWLVLATGAAALGLLVLAPIVLKNPWIWRRFAKGAPGGQQDGKPHFGDHALPLFGAVQAMAFIVQFIALAMFAFAAMAVDAPVNWALFAVGHAFITVVTLVPVSLAGLGVREASMAALFESVGLEASAGVAVGLIFFMIQLSGSIFGLIPLFGKSGKDARASR